MPQVREACQYEVKGGAENKQGKANVLLQVGPRSLDCLPVCCCCRGAQRERPFVLVRAGGSGLTHIPVQPN